jgi:hypothetical protein
MQAARLVVQLRVGEGWDAVDDDEDYVSSSDDDNDGDSGEATRLQLQLRKEKWEAMEAATLATASATHRLTQKHRLKQ